MAAWDRYSALLFRGQSLANQDLIAFSRRFGGLDLAPVQENGRTSVAGLPEMYVVSNILDTEGRPIGSLGAGEAVWHTDMSYLREPAGRVDAVRDRDAAGRRRHLGFQHDRGGADDAGRPAPRRRGPQHQA